MSVVTSGAGRQVLLEWGSLARGASTGFTVLFIGGWLFPAAHRVSPAIGVTFLVVVGVIGFGAAGARCGRTGFPALHGVIAALLSYALMVPVVLIAYRQMFPGQLGWAIGCAIVVGAAAGHLSARRHPDGARS